MGVNNTVATKGFGAFGSKTFVAGSRSTREIRVVTYYAFKTKPISLQLLSIRRGRTSIYWVDGAVANSCDS